MRVYVRASVLNVTFNIILFCAIFINSVAAYVPVIYILQTSAVLLCFILWYLVTLSSLYLYSFYLFVVSILRVPAFALSMVLLYGVYPSF
jgi:hypothetical protein